MSHKLACRNAAWRVDATRGRARRRRDRCLGRHAYVSRDPLCEPTHPASTDRQFHRPLAARCVRCGAWLGRASAVRARRRPSTVGATRVAGAGGVRGRRPRRDGDRKSASSRRRAGSRQAAIPGEAAPRTVTSPQRRVGPNNVLDGRRIGTVRLCWRSAGGGCARWCPLIARARVWRYSRPANCSPAAGSALPDRPTARSYSKCCLTARLSPMRKLQPEQQATSAASAAATRSLRRAAKPPRYRSRVPGSDSTSHYRDTLRAHSLLTSSDGDEFGSAGSRADNCRQLGPALVECLVFDLELGSRRDRQLSMARGAVGYSLA